MRRLAGALVATLALAGCGEAPEQHAARVAVERAAAAADRPGRTRCTSNSRRWFREGPPARVFLCVVRRGGAACDRYRVARARSSYRATLVRRDADCVLPVG